MDGYTIEAYLPHHGEALGGLGPLFAKLAQNMADWIKEEVTWPDMCRVFFHEGRPIGGMIFTSFTPQLLDVLDFVLLGDHRHRGAQLLAESVALCRQDSHKTVSYHLYADNDQYGGTLQCFAQAGFRVVQEKKSYSLEAGALAHVDKTLSFCGIEQAGEEAFARVTQLVTRGTLDRLMAAEAAQLGGAAAAGEYLDRLREIDFNPAWWQLGYLGGQAAGLVIAQQLAPGLGGINYIGVVPQLRGRGLSRQLLHTGTKALLDAGLPRIIADTDSGNAPMAAALEALGYVFQFDESVLELAL